MFSINLVSIDSYQSAPLSELDVTFSDFRGNGIRQVPVIRIFGSTPSGIKTCLHIHGVFPYIYIPCTVDQNISGFVYKLAAAIDSTINISLGTAMSNTQHVYKIQRVSGIPLYGYHRKEHLFFKIYFYNPAMIKRAADLLQNGNILGQSLQPHEAHIPFILQFMVDYNLYGMSLINLSGVKIRRGVQTDAKEESQDESSLQFDSQKYLPASIARQSTCKLEVDAQASEILNRLEIQNGIDLNPGIAAIWSEETYRREAKGLQNAESQLLYTNDDGRVYGPTDSDIYQEERLMKRLQDIPRVDEHATPLTSKTLSYPLEADEGDNSFNASHVLNHFQPSVSCQENKNEALLNSELLGLENTMARDISFSDKTMECSILDSEDMHLVEILDNLAEENKEEKIVDEDSMLGSQCSIFSNQIKEQNDDDEIEDLNITSLDLDSLGSWKSFTDTVNQLRVPENEDKKAEDCEETDREIEDTVADSSSMDFPQYDGPNDLFFKNKCSRLKQKLIREFKNKRRKSSQGEHSMPPSTNINLHKLDHQDLDVYDVDEFGHDLTLNDYETFNTRTIPKNCGFNRINYRKFPFTISQALNDSNIPALDGNTNDSASDSDVEQDVTINREEKRICVYKSCTKSKNEVNVVNSSSVSLKRQRIELEDAHLQNSQKRRNTNTDCGQSEPCRTPIKTKPLQSPRSLTKKYSPLNVTIRSPKSDKKNEINSACSSKSSCFTPKRDSQQLRKSLFRGKINTLASQIKQVDPSHSIAEGVNDTHRGTEQDDSTVKNKELINLDKGDHNAAEENIQTPSLSRNVKEVRKRLSFINATEEDIDSKKDNIDECNFDNLSLTEEIVDNSFQGNSLTSVSIMNSFRPEKSLGLYTEKDSEVNCEYNVPSTSRNKENLCIDNTSDRMELINEDDAEEDEDEQDICNMTYTQYLNSKIESESDTQVAVSLEGSRDITQNRSITIVTKYNPPNRERIIKTMKMYNISESKYNGPFFSNKEDLVKQKVDSKKNNDHDLVPFKSSLDRVSGIKLWRRLKINEFYPSGASIKSCDIKRALSGYNTITIHSLIQPPTVKHVKTWLQAKKYLSKKNTEHQEVKSNIDIVPDNKESILINETSTDKQCAKQQSHSSNNLSCSLGSNDSVSSSLRKMLENPMLYKHNDTQQHLGISFGQIEFSFKRPSGNVENENLQVARGLTVHQYLTILSIEVHVVTRDKLLPDPEHDSIAAIFYAIHNDVPSSSKAEQIEHGAIVVNSNINNSKIRNVHSTSTLCPTSYVSSEGDLLNSLIIVIRHCDPDILVGWEIECLSWGYVIHRASRIGIKNFMWQISRISNVTPTSKAQTPDDENLTDVKIPGRIVLDAWRIMRPEMALLNYTFENVMYHVMRERISCPTFETLTEWWRHKSVTIQWRVITHYVVRVVGTLRMLIHLDIIGRTSEHARLIGIQFYEVFSRGSQFRVESMMLRLAKPLNYIPISPSIQQRANMRAPEYIPLIMEPQSTFYSDPLIVLDFQSLYPSIIIAYNYCFSTCLGRVENIGQYEPFEFGAATLKVNKDTANKLLGKINFAPCGVAFVKPEVRTGILPRMLEEILNTRLMVKQSMKIHGNENQVLQRVLHSQQLGLKLIANVTYGYTAANFSGRMPCMEVADSVVSKGRETLERAIKIVESTPKWGAQVVYGDTDSLFILLPGKSRKDAFTIGAEIADTITADNPPPVKLKFEKVLQPSILQTKKRYCGYMYETPEQEEPEYLAKGIETVRRDGCPAVAKILEKTLKILFDTKDLSLIKLYVTRQFDKILRRKISIQDLTFAKEFRGLRGYKPTASVPALELTRRLTRKDPRAIPRTGERVRYVIVAGAPNQPLIHCVRTPMEVITDEGLNPNSIYYITKVIIPPLNRCLNLIGIDVSAWYREMSHRHTPDKVVQLCTDNQKFTIRQYFGAVICAACGEQTRNDICSNCIAKPDRTTTILYEKLRWLERTHHELTMICQSCTGYLEEPKCESFDCPVLYRLMQARRDLIQIPYLNGIIQDGDTFNTERRNIK